jgi:hypothetical protein
MLYQVLEEIEQARGPVLINELSRKLNLDPGVLRGMIQFWVRKGRLCDDDALAGEGQVCAGGGCGDSCSGMANCSFVAKMPKTYSVSRDHITVAGK